MWVRTLALAVGAQQGLAVHQEHVERRAKYQVARDYADSVRKPMLVVGGPYGGNSVNFWFRVPAHGWGDVCLDLNPETCSGGPPELEIIEADVRNIPFSDKYFGSAFVSHVLEHLPTVNDAQMAFAELNRVSNKVIVASPGKDVITSWLNPDHHLWVQQKNDGSLVVEQR